IISSNGNAADARVTVQAYRKHLHRLRRSCMLPTQSVSNDLWLRKHFRLFICSEAFGAFAVTSTSLHIYSPCHALASDCAKPTCLPYRPELEKPCATARGQHPD